VESSLFLLDLLTGHEPAVAPERELSQLATLRQATRVGRFSARANIRAAVWDKPRSSLRRPDERRFVGRIVFYSTENSEEPLVSFVVVMIKPLNLGLDDPIPLRLKDTRGGRRGKYRVPFH
jgi:hypothetical protein